MNRIFPDGPMFDLSFPDVLSLVQTVAIIAALVIAVYFARRQIQALAIDLETRVLNDLDEKFHRIGEIFIDRPELVRTIYNIPVMPGPELPFTYYVLFFCAHAYHMHQRQILTQNEWTGWFQWMKNAFQYGNVGKLWKETEMGRWFDPAFREFVDRELLPTTLGTS